MPRKYKSTRKGFTYLGTTYPSIAAAGRAMGIQVDKMYHYSKIGFTSGDAIIAHRIAKAAKAASRRPKVHRGPLGPRKQAVPEVPRTKEEWAEIMAWYDKRLQEIKTHGYVPKSSAGTAQDYQEPLA